MVLHLGDDDLVAWPDAVGRRRPGQHVRHQVECLGGVLGEDDLVPVRGADERGDFVARALVERGRLLRQHVDAPVHVGVVQLVVIVERLEDRARFLRRRRAVEVDQRAVPVDPTLKDREVLADLLDIDHVDAPANFVKRS